MTSIKLGWDINDIIHQSNIHSSSCPTHRFWIFIFINDCFDDFKIICGMLFNGWPWREL